jgi:hypothetical protein
VKEGKHIGCFGVPFDTYPSSCLTCVRVQQNILNAENKRDKIFVDEMETR